MSNFVCNRAVPAAIAFGLAFGLAAPLVAKIGLYDFADASWYKILFFAPVVSALIIGVNFTRVKNILRQSRLEFIGYTLLFTVPLCVLAWYLGNGQASTFTYCNNSELTISAAVRFQPDRFEVVTGDFKDLSSGQCLDVTAKFLRVPVVFQISVTDKNDLPKWINDSERSFNFDAKERLEMISHGFSEAAPTVESRTANLPGEKLEWETSPLYPVASGTTDSNADPSNPGSAPFINIFPSAQNDYRETVWFKRSGINRTLEVCNLQPVETVVDLYYRSKQKEWRIDSGVKLKPGSCEKFTRNFQGTEPAFALRSTIGGDVVDWFFNRRKVVFEGDKVVSACQNSQAQTAVFNSAPGGMKCAAGAKRISFASVPAKFTGDATESFNLTFDEREIPLPKTGDRIDVEKAKNKIAQLAPLWVRRLDYMKEWDGAEIPYLICAEVAETVSHNVQGVLVTGTCGDGDDDGFMTGDVILEFENKPVFSPIDLEMYVKDFAEDTANGGALKKFKYKVYRGSQNKGVLEEREGTFYFNGNYWLAREDQTWQWLWSFSWGVASNIGLDNAVNIYCSGENQKDYCVWSTQQRVMRLKQFNSTSYGVGQFVGEAALHLLLTRFLGRILGGTLVAEMVAGGTVSAIQEVFWLYENAGPGQNLKGDFRRNVLTAAGQGAALTILLRR